MYISLFPSSWALFNFFTTFSSSSLSVNQSSSSYSSSSSEYSLPGSSKSGIYVKGAVSMISSKPQVCHFLLTTVTLKALFKKKHLKLPNYHCWVCYKSNLRNYCFKNIVENVRINTFQAGKTALSSTLMTWLWFPCYRCESDTSLV